MSEQTITKAQKFYTNSLKSSFKGMEQRIRESLLKLQNENADQQTEDLPTVTSNLIREELAPVLTATLDGCLQHHVHGQYALYVKGYTER